jgi:signal transduction histidine kinase
MTIPRCDNGRMSRAPDDYRRLLRLGAAGVAVVVAVPVLARQWLDPQNAATTADLVRWLLVLAIAQTAGALVRWPAAATLMQTIGALLLVAMPPCFGFEGALLVMVALRLGFEQRRGVALTWVLVQSAAMFAILGMHWNFRASLLVTGAYLPFQLLALLVSAAVAGEVAARLDLVRVNAELVATRELLAERSRADERTRISRDLHDVLGHHLVALSLHLELAGATGGEESASHLGKAKALAASLLDDVRATVHAMRAPANVVEALHAIAAETPRPAVHVDASPDLDVGTPDVAEAMILCAQELVTNAVKHSGAGHLWLTLRQDDSRLELRATDDGRGAEAVALRGGIAGMDERLRRHGGGVIVQTAAGRGFSVTAWLPCPQ